MKAHRVKTKHAGTGCWHSYLTQDPNLALNPVSGCLAITGWKGLHGSRRDKGGLSALHFVVAKHQVMYVKSSINLELLKDNRKELLSMP